MDRHIRVDALHNFRDLGAYRTPDGHRVRPGRLDRSDSLGKLTEDTEDWPRFLALGVRTGANSARWTAEMDRILLAAPTVADAAAIARLLPKPLSEPPMEVAARRSTTARLSSR